MFDTYTLGIAVGTSDTQMQHAALYILNDSHHKGQGTIYYAKFQPSLGRFSPESDPIHKRDFHFNRAPGFAGFISHPIRDIGESDRDDVHRVYMHMERATAEGRFQLNSAFDFVRALAQRLDRDGVGRHHGNQSLSEQVNRVLGGAGGMVQPQGFGMGPGAYMGQMNQMGPPMQGYGPNPGYYGGPGQPGPYADAYGGGYGAGYGRNGYGRHSRRYRRYNSGCTIM